MQLGLQGHVRMRLTCLDGFCMFDLGLRREWRRTGVSFPVTVHRCISRCSVASYRENLLLSFPLYLPPTLRAPASLRFSQTVPTSESRNNDRMDNRAAEYSTSPNHFRTTPLVVIRGDHDGILHLCVMSSSSRSAREGAQLPVAPLETRSGL